jgi:hypothetical protein
MVFAEEGPDHELVRVGVTVLDALSEADSFVFVVENCVVGGHEVETKGPHGCAGCHELDDARVEFRISHIPLVSRDDIPYAVNIKGDIWDRSVLSGSATACSQSVRELFTNAVAEEVVHNSVVVDGRENVQRSSTINNAAFSRWGEGEVTNSHVAELKSPEVFRGELVPLQRTLGIFFEVITTDLHHGDVALVDEHGVHVLLDGSLLVESGNEQLLSIKSVRGSKANNTVSSVAPKVFLLDHCLKLVIFYATVANLAVWVQAEGVKTVIAPDLTKPILQSAEMEVSLTESGAH